MKKIKVFETFAGYGSQRMALKRLPIEHEVVGISEIDKYVIQAYNAVHGETPNFGDISKINWDEVPDFDLFTMSSPCQDFSTNGKQLGGEEGSGTRSSLLWECRKAIAIKKPKYILFENVKGLIGKKFIKGFLLWQNQLTNMGYSNFTQVLNSKDYNIPQNRERVFMVSILGNNWYNFPTPIKLNKIMYDMLDSNVDSKYFMTKEQVDMRLNSSFVTTRLLICNKDIIGTLCARDYKDPRIVKVNNEYRKVTEIEYLRLMGVSEEDIIKIKSTNLAKSHIYKMAGNSIVVDVLEAIFRNLLIPQPRQTLFG